MNRVFIGAALAVALIGSTTAYAATTPAPTTAAAPAAAPDYAAECTSLAAQWTTAAAANATNAKLGKATAKAKLAEKNCGMTAKSKQKTGVGQYKAALKLLGVTPTM